jgi:ABC-2 type transport system permease protein
MKNVAALTQREFFGFIFSPIAYLTGFAFLLLSGVLFTYTTLIPGNESSIRPMFSVMASVFVLCVPVLTMRLLSDEYATGTIETLMTAPVSDAEVVLSKFLGVFLFYCVLVALTILHVAMIAVFGQLDVGVTLVAYLGLLLLGGLYAAVGVFTSACTRYQLLAALAGIGLLSCLTFLTDYLSLQFPGARHVLGYLNVLGQFDIFSRGILDTAALAYFLSGTAFFLFLAVKVVESKRWR